MLEPLLTILILDVLVCISGSSERIKPLAGLVSPGNGLAMDEGQGERIRASRVKELEAMVRKLETENQQLLTKMRPNESSARARGEAVPGDREERVGEDVSSRREVGEGGEDDWWGDQRGGLGPLSG